MFFFLDEGLLLTLLKGGFRAGEMLLNIYFTDDHKYHEYVPTVLA